MARGSVVPLDVVASVLCSIEEVVELVRLCRIDEVEDSGLCADD